LIGSAGVAGAANTLRRPLSRDVTANTINCRTSSASLDLPSGGEAGSSEAGAVRSALPSCGEFKVTSRRRVEGAGMANDGLIDQYGRKRPGHAINDPSFLQPARPMSAIGG
jgi:hypothetical protein